MSGIDPSTNSMKSKIVFLTKQIVEVKLKGKFIGERGKINCSLKERNVYWRRL